jgi:RNA-binding protein NOB1
MNWIHKRKGSRRVHRYLPPNLFWRICAEGRQVEQELEVEAVAESLNKATLEDQRVEPLVESTTAKKILRRRKSLRYLALRQRIDLQISRLAEPENPLPTPPETPPLYEDPSDEDDGEGEWITPTNAALHKSKALQLIPAQGGVNKVITGCMTTDFAMQNVLMHMGLSLVGVDGKKIEKVKTWVLRCHACFK